MKLVPADRGSQNARLTQHLRCIKITALKNSQTQALVCCLHAIIFGDEHVSLALHSCFPLTTRRKDGKLMLWTCGSTPSLSTSVAYSSTRLGTQSVLLIHQLCETAQRIASWFFANQDSSLADEGKCFTQSITKFTEGWQMVNLLEIISKRDFLKNVYPRKHVKSIMFSPSLLDPGA